MESDESDEDFLDVYVVETPNDDQIHKMKNLIEDSDNMVLNYIEKLISLLKTSIGEKFKDVEGRLMTSIQNKIANERFDDIYKIVDHGAKIGALENKVGDQLSREDFQKMLSDSFDEEIELRKIITQDDFQRMISDSFKEEIELRKIITQDDFQRMISASFVKEIKDQKIVTLDDIGDYVKKERSTQKEGEKDTKNSSKDIDMRKLKTYKNKMKKIKKEEKKLKKETGEVLSDLTTNASVFSILMGGFIMQSTTPKPEYWVLLPLSLRCIMLMGTIIIVIISFTDMNHKRKELHKLETRRKDWCKESKQLIDGINPLLQEKGELPFKVTQTSSDGPHEVLQIEEQSFLWDFQLLAVSNNTIESVPWHRWLSLSLIGAFAILVPILLLIDTIESAKKEGTTLEIVGLLLFMFHKVFFWI